MNQVTIDEEGPGLGVDDLKRKEVNGNIFVTTLTIDQCRRILRSTARHAINFRQMSNGAKLTNLIEAMKKDLWVWTDADPIRLHLHVESGEIVCSDGQHRVYAAIQARRQLRCLVLWGDGWKAGVHVDRNRPRNVAQFLQHEHGINSAAIYAAAARLHLGRVMGVEEGLAVNYARTVLDDEAIINFVLTNRDVLHWCINAGSVGGERGFGTTGYHVFLYELHTISPEIAQQFQDDMKNSNLDPNDPVAQLRRSVSRRYNDTGVRANATFTLNNLVKAHNMRAAGETTSKWVNATNDGVTLPAGFKINGKMTRSTR